MNWLWSFLWVCFCISRPLHGATDPTDSMVMAEMAKTLKVDSSWTGSDPCSRWKGVSCSGNKVSGTLPADLKKLPSLKKLDVRNNQLSGAIPKFTRSVMAMTGGNPQIGKPPLPWSSPASPDSPGNSYWTSSGSDAGGSGGWGGLGSEASIALVAVVLVIFNASLCFCYTWRKRQCWTHVQSPTTVAPNPHSSDAPAPYLSNGGTSDGHVVEPTGKMEMSIEVLRDATNNFSEENVLGQGSFGKVYKGELHDGSKIAVKRMDEKNEMGSAQFKAEINALTKVRHRHLVGFRGYCKEGREKVLVYEYMAQGPLSRHLYEGKEAGLRPLDWKQRLRVALDVARGVEYLHSLAQDRFIHRDVKPSNILLDDNMRAKVSDFGFVKRVPDGRSSVEASKLAGTFGYMPREYTETGRLTPKMDVFSFGAVLMELITGRKALDLTQPEERKHLVTWFRLALKRDDGLHDAVDPVLYLTDDNFQSIRRVAKLARSCTSAEPLQRPTMSHVVNVLCPLVEQWNPNKAA